MDGLTWFTNSNQIFKLNSIDDIFLMWKSGSAISYTDEEIKNAIKSEIQLQFENAPLAQY